MSKFLCGALHSICDSRSAGASVPGVGRKKYFLGVLSWTQLKWYSQKGGNQILCFEQEFHLLVLSSLRACGCQWLRTHLPVQETEEMWVRSLGWGDPLEKMRQPTPVFLPGESHEQRRLAGKKPLGFKELDMTEASQHRTLQTSLQFLSSSFSL